jgi:EAL domain-containing protein (putative c-di-GMP-specific phosphodiesterase class I)
MSPEAVLKPSPAPHAPWSASDMYQHIRWLIDAQAIAIVYQPIRALATGRVVGYEALSRFGGVDHGPVEEVFASARSLGLGLELELAAAAEALFALPDIPGYLAINLSPATLLDDTALRLLERAPAERLVVELTEHDAVADYARLRERLRDLRARGVRVAADDIGAGFAGLRHIAELRPDILKLDRSMVGGIANGATHRHLVSAMVAFARDEGSQLVAEGVETRDELAILGELGVEMGQGYLLGRPLPLDRHSDEAGTGSARESAKVIRFPPWHRRSPLASDRRR